MNYGRSYAPNYSRTGSTGTGCSAPLVVRDSYGNLVRTGAEVPPKDPAKPGITDKAWWMETTVGDVPRYAAVGGAAALGLIGYGWYTGFFDGKSGGGKKRRR